MKSLTFSACHDGVGELQCHIAMLPEDGSASVHFVHDDILPPGVSIGEHRHERNEEIYMVVEGRGTLIFDGERRPVGPGDISLCAPGHSHGLINDSDQPLRLIVIGIKEEASAAPR